MATLVSRVDVPATYARGFDSTQQAALSRLLGWYTNQTGRLQYIASASGALLADSRPVVITLGSAAALTLPAPALTQDGMTRVFTSASAFAHVITSTGNFQNGVLGGAKNTATFAAFPGASMTLMAYQGKWHVVSLNAVTVA